MWPLRCMVKVGMTLKRMWYGGLWSGRRVIKSQWDEVKGPPHPTTWLTYPEAEGYLSRDLAGKLLIPVRTSTPHKLLGGGGGGGGGAGAGGGRGGGSGGGGIFVSWDLKGVCQGRRKRWSQQQWR